MEKEQLNASSEVPLELELQRLRKRGPYAKTASRQRKILEAAAQVYAEYGYYGSSLREIAAKAGMSLSTLTHHFASKEEILMATLEQRDADGVSLHSVRTAADFRRQVLNQAKANEKSSALIGLYSVLSAESTTPDHPARSYFIDRFSVVRRDYSRVLELLRDRDELRPGLDPRLTAISLVALWDGLQLQWLLEPKTVDVVAQLSIFLDLILVSD
ncbi:TetR family transcriptional regulator [Psychromicrobium sp. YIM B11713]|uniref:TetR family transcriptional regulator n=1 Tax=Psychromicrobium sp. YIM B11713 TaxID=3145233 RepID=UPI00374F9549